jgi:agmatine deiminase
MPLTLPPEWDPQRAVWFTWPQNAETWKPVWAEAEAVYEKAVREALRFQDVVLLVSTPELRQKMTERFASSGGGTPAGLEILVCPTNDSWIRDYGGLTACATEDAGRNRPMLLSFAFNSWGGKYPPWDADNAVPHFMARHRGYELLEIPFVLEGGSIDVNGRGLLLTTRSCLLHPNRNPGKSPEEIEATLRRHLGITEILWLESGIDGDDTDGHIDDLARFVDPKTVFCAMETNAADENYAALRRNARQLEEYARGLGLEVVEVPMPGRQIRAGLRTPATYMNFLILNGAVLLPVFDDPADAVALDLFTKHFPGREIVPLDCRALVYGQGAIHCSSMQEAKIGRKTGPPKKIKR